MKRIAIHSVPRSGSTWLGSIFDSNSSVAYRYQPLFSYTHKSQLSSDSTLKEIKLFFNDIYHTDDEFVLQKEAVKKKIVPEFRKDKITHIVYKEVRYHHIIENLLNNDPDIKVIGLIRNPLSVVFSWLNAPREFRKDLGWDEEEEWEFATKKNQNRPEEFNGYQKWKEVSALFELLQKRFPKQFYLLNYIDLLKDKNQTVNKIFDFCELKVGSQTKEFLQSSSSIDKSSEAYSVYRIKRKDDNWKGIIKQSIQEAIEKDLKDSPLKKYL